MLLPSTRVIYFSIFFLCAFLMSGAFFFEFVMGLEPCPLCMAQRVAVILIGTFALLAGIHNPGKTGKVVYGLFVLSACALGVGLAARQVWLQSLPEDLVPACGPGIYYMLDVLPITDVVRSMLTGSGDCAEVLWRDPVLKLSIPGWTLVWFSFMTLVSLFLIARKEPRG